MNITGFKKYMSKYNIEVLNYKRDNARVECIETMKEYNIKENENVKI